MSIASRHSVPLPSANRQEVESDELQQQSVEQLPHRRRLNLAFSDRRDRANRRILRQGTHVERSYVHHDFHAPALIELASTGELSDLLEHPIHELEELAESVGKFGHDLRLKSYDLAKRCLDVVFALLAFVIALPVMSVAAVIVKLTDGGPILYSHTRVGLNGREFQCCKFRSMIQDADSIKSNLEEINSHSDSRTFKIPNDPRVTRFGRLMRKLSIDELPQLWNILRGDMSFVGPRPPVPTEVEQYTLDDMERLTVKPGLTCIWQVSGRSKIAFPEQLQMDLDYIDNRSLLLDLKILALTIPAVISGDGAY